MKKSSILFRKILFLSLLAFLWLPQVFNKFKIFHLHPLSGTEQNAPNSNFSVHGWFSGDYQKGKELYLNDGFGLRELFVRLNNQILFTFFNKSSAQGVVIGKNNYLYEEGYIKAYYGDDFLGDSAIAHRMKRLKFINDTLTKLHKTFIVIFAPGKASFYPEYIPNNYGEATGKNNYKSYITLTGKLNINCIDLYSYFLQNKNKSKYPLYTKYGVHWTSYADCLVADSIIKYIEHDRNIQMPHIYWKYVKMGPPKDRDADVEDGMNLLFRLKPDTLAYPHIEFESDYGKTRPRALVIGDSYFKGIYDMGFFKCFSNSDFWYYNKEVFNDRIAYGHMHRDFWHYDTNVFNDYISLAPHNGISLKSAIAKHNVIIIIATDGGLHDFSWNFIEQAYAALGGPDKMMNNVSRTARLKIIIDHIKANNDWMLIMEKQAKDRKISLDSTIMLNAIYELQAEQ